MSEFKEKCGDVLTGGSVGEAVEVRIGRGMGWPATSTVAVKIGVTIGILGAKIGGAMGTLAGIFWE